MLQSNIIKGLIKGEFQSIIYTGTNSTGATKRFPTNHKMSSEQKNWSSFILDQS